MPAMLPVAPDGATRLADVLAGAFAATSGAAAALALPPVRSAVVVLVDGLGASNLKARAGHARTLAGRLGKKDVAWSTFPSTTAVALATLTTGVPAGEHGLVGYSVLDAAHDRVVNQLSGWDARMVPEVWQPRPTLFESALERGIRPVAIGAPSYATSGLTRAVLRGADYVGGRTIDERVDLALATVRTGPSLVYLYVPELDQAGHRDGWESDRWTGRLEELDGAIARLERGLPRDVGMLVSADHGMLDVPPHRHVLLDATPGLLDGVRHVAGEPRCRYLYFEPALAAADRDALVSRWRDAESHRAWVASGDEAIAAGYFGDVDPAVRPRIPDLLVAARSGIAYYDGRDADQAPRKMIGQHGSLTDDERRVPLLRFGAFAR
ncbi:alkaline phosphatase family protein [Agromyces seonyuensis]|uniref:Alkaline phosphatase family protein n=1 Tax=Agromyces seonyuensis TaxID=2662446 RepID=A0A6I4NZA0_9MICO|nr:nucleotide pyrophosphatase/phosphodiesterase family protein [Agromyces seonyuensis]MWB99646.1 alkaline phosphatase family protein [Agromyces seonyuensis]